MNKCDCYESISMMNVWMQWMMNVVKWMKNEWMNKWMNEWLNEWMNEWMNERINEGKRWMNELKKWMNEWTNEWTLEQEKRRIKQSHLKNNFCCQCFCTVRITYLGKQIFE